MKTVTLYTDGACSGNPGPGGWGAILEYGPHRVELSGGEKSTTNNRMELTAVIRALSLLKEPCVVEPWIVSKYVIDGLSKGCPVMVWLESRKPFQPMIFSKERSSTGRGKSASQSGIGSTAVSAPPCRT